MKTVKIFRPHIEIRLHVTEEMEKDFEECKNFLDREDDFKDCDKCSWNGCEIGNEYGCVMYEEYLKSKEGDKDE